jgi:hypothetical protein
MHKLRFKSQLHAFRIASLLICIEFLCIACALAMFAGAAVAIKLGYALIGIGLGILAGLTSFTRALTVGHIRCPLCMAAVFSPLNTNRHRDAWPLPGRQRLRIAFSILFRGSFRCPDCDESTAMKLRQLPRTRHSAQR